MYFLQNHRMLVQSVAHILKIGFGLMQYPPNYCLQIKNASQTQLNEESSLDPFWFWTPHIIRVNIYIHTRI